MPDPAMPPAAKDTPPLGGEPAEQLQLLWSQGQAPNVDDYLARAGALTPAQVAAVLRVDQRQRWQAGQRVAAEAYLQRHPEVQADAEAIIDLIYNEYLLTARLGTPPLLEQFLGRFPKYAATLRQQIELHQALASGTAVTVPPSLLVTDLPSTRPRARTADASSSATSPNADAAKEHQPPQKLGRYRIQKLLGRGGIGAVYQAHDTLLDRLVALKVIQLAGDDDEKVVQRFYQEARAAAGFTHPHLCPVYDVGAIDDIHYLTMPLLPGQTLAAWLGQSGPLPEAEAARWAAEIARALQAAHDAGVVHRDLKPSNIMINDRAEPVVIDFGLALRHSAGASRLTPAGGVLGTPAYLAPEQISARAGTIGPATDVYGLGAIFYQMLTGRPPFQGPVYDVLRQIPGQEPARPSHLRPGLSAALEAICRKAMSKSTAARYASMAALADALESFAPRTRTSPTHVNRPMPAAGGTRRNRLRLWLVLGVVGIVLLGVWGISVFMSQRPIDPERPRDSEAAQAHVHRAWGYNNDGKHNLAIKECDLALQLDDRCVEALVCRAYAFIETKRLDNALDDLNRAIALDPDYHMSYVDRAWAYNEKGEPAKAILDANRAIQLKPDNAEAYYQRGAAYNKQKMYTEAIVDFTKAIQINPNYAWAFHERAMVYDTLGQQDLATKDRKKAAELDPAVGHPQVHGDVLQPGTLWKGDFVFREPFKNYSGNVELLITMRSGKAFQGEYATESNKWRWKIKGVIDQHQLSWEFTEIIKEFEQRDVVGKAKVRATLHGQELQAEFYIPNTMTCADMTLKLQK